MPRRLTGSGGSPHGEVEVAEVVETEERIREVLPELDRTIGGGLNTLERAHVITYRPEPRED